MSLIPHITHLKLRLKATTLFSLSTTTEVEASNNHIASTVLGISIKMELLYAISVIRHMLSLMTSSQSLARVRVVSIVTIKVSIMSW